LDTDKARLTSLMPQFDLKLRWMSSLLRIASDEESADDSGHE